MLKQYLGKKKKIIRGFLHARIKRDGLLYNPESWWDKDFYTSGISDRHTISPEKNPISSLYHYCSIELIILRYMFNRHIMTSGTKILDIGSGSGHWIDFWKNLGAESILGVDISRSAIEYLSNKYAADPSIEIRHGHISNILKGLNKRFSIVNAIGVMFHLVEEREWSEVLIGISAKMETNGLLVANGNFGFLNGVNMQIDRNGYINKRLRSKKCWITQLKKSGFSNWCFFRNHGYLGIKDTLPESNILIARK